jgi:ABC-type nitrate/sulfonate/bicarbonate transport system permease component
MPTGGKARRRSPRATPRWVLLAVVIGLMVVWELVSRLELVNPMFISRPTDIFTAIPDVLGDEKAVDALKTTGESIWWAIVYAVCIGIVGGYLLGSVRLLRDAFYGPVNFIIGIPKSIFIPIFLLVFGINTQTAIYYGAFSGIFYVMINVVGGLDLVEDRHMMVARAYSASWWHRVRDIVLPASTPGVFAGIWYGIKNGLQGVLIFELFISVGGLGSLIKAYTNRLEVDRVFVVVLGVSVVAIVLGEIWSAIERRLSRWRPSATATADTAV